MICKEAVFRELIDSYINSERNSYIEGWESLEYDYLIEENDKELYEAIEGLDELFVAYESYYKKEGTLFYGLIDELEIPFYEDDVNNFLGNSGWSYSDFIEWLKETNDYSYDIDDDIVYPYVCDYIQFTLQVPNGLWYAFKNEWEKHYPYRDIPEWIVRELLIMYGLKEKEKINLSLHEIIMNILEKYQNEDNKEVYKNV